MCISLTRAKNCNYIYIDLCALSNNPIFGQVTTYYDFYISNEMMFDM